MERKRQMKPYEELTFADDFMFCKILTQNKQICKELIEIVLDRPIRDIKYVNSQENMKFTYDSKGVRLDVYAEDYKNTVYDVEMQIDINRNLPKRIRYYQGMIDLNMIKQGEDYENLKKSFVIFFCFKDPFGENLPVYIFENRCNEKNELTLGDEATKIFVNVSGNLDNVSPQLAALLRYLKSKKATNSFTQKIDSEVKRNIAHNEWRNEYMTFEQRIRDERKDAWEEGREEGVKSYYETVINNPDKSPKEIFDMIMSNIQ